jgi:hypothetical protein
MESASKVEVTMVEPLEPSTVDNLPGMIDNENQNASLLAAGDMKSIPEPDKNYLKDGSQQKVPTMVDAGALEDLTQNGDSGCGKRMYRQMIQQELRRSPLPLMAFKELPQAACAGCCAVVFFIIGVLLLVSASGIEELEVGYSHTDANKAFTVGTSMEGPVLVWYDLPNFRLNRKRIVSSKDKAIWGFPTSSYQCKDAKTLQEVDWRRPSAPFQAILSAPGANAFRPCGLVATAMFTDTFSVNTAAGSPVALDYTDIALSSDKRLYEENSDLQAVSGQSYDYTLDGTPSWLTTGNLERFKVWSRTPPSPHVRQLYARIEAGLPAGRYWLNFTVNDPIFEVRWESEKSIIFSESHALGSMGALTCLGVFCIIIAVFEVLTGILFLAAPACGMTPAYTAPSP